MWLHILMRAENINKKQKAQSEGLRLFLGEEELDKLGFDKGMK